MRKRVTSRHLRHLRHHIGLRRAGPAALLLSVLMWRRYSGEKSSKWQGWAL
jgi:hypothetical protein